VDSPTPELMTQTFSRRAKKQSNKIKWDKILTNKKKKKKNKTEKESRECESRRRKMGKRLYDNISMGGKLGTRAMPFV